jgi:type I restriction enzyme S subunit
MAKRGYIHVICPSVRERAPRFRFARFKEELLPLPPFPEQSAIIAYLDQETAKIDALVAEALRAITLLKERRSALISAAVTGKIDVRGLAKAEAA